VTRGSTLLAIALAGCGFSVSASGGVGDSAPDDAAIDGAVDAPPDQFVAIPACMTNPAYTDAPDGHRYRKTSAVNYDRAIDTCAADGAHLVVFETRAEQDFVDALAGTDVWIGIDDLTTEGIFKWITGAPNTYSGFMGAEPNDAGTEDCTYLDVSGDDWNDTSCDETREAVCECELGYTPPPTPMCRTLPGGFTEIDGRRYFLEEATPRSWAAAKTACEAIGAYLSVFADLDETDHVDGQFSGDSWIGLSDQTTEGTWTWVNGSTDAYRKWGTAAPHIGDTARNCVRVNITWQDVECAELREYSCECDPLPP
jgi:hypothetical protein